MKKAALVIFLIVIVQLIFVRWSSKAVNAPPDVTQIPAGTTLTTGLSIDQMIDKSDLIAIGSCVDTKSVWVDRTLVTLSTISVAETLKGAELGAITVALPGGIDANRKFPIAVTYPGAPRLAPGEDMFLFLTASAETTGSYTVTGFSQGKFSIVKNEQGERFVTQDLSGTMLKDNNGLRRGSTGMRPLSSLKAQVKARLRQQ
jgi:hypothetical protein